MRQSRFMEEQIVGIPKEVRGGNGNRGAVPQAWHQRTDVLSLEDQVWRAGSER